MIKTDGFTIGEYVGRIFLSTLLTRVAHVILKKYMPNDYKRAFVVFGFVTGFLLILLSIDEGITLGVIDTISFYLPWLAIWLVIDARRALKGKKTII